MTSKVLLAVILSAMMSVPLLADTIGFIEIDRVLYSSNKAKELEEAFKKKGEEYQKLIDKNQKKLDKAREKGKSDDYINSLLKEIDEELRPKQEALVQEQAQAQQALISQIISATNVIAKDNGIDVVLDKRAIIGGGYDLTDFVIDKVNQ